MTVGPLAKVTAKTAAEVCKHITLDEGPQKLLDEKQTLKQFLESLCEKGLYVDAIKVLAYGMPKREAVWWGCLCVRSAAGKDMPGEALKALEAAEKWVADPSEANRVATLDAGKAADFSTPPGCVALAAYWSAGADIPAHAGFKPPPDQWTADAVAGCVLSAAIQTEPEKAAEKFQKHFELGLAVASGTSVWKK
jgi:hypothetical protein